LLKKKIESISFKLLKANYNYIIDNNQTTKRNMSITYKLIPLKLKKGNRKIFLEEIDTIYYPDEIWNIIKEYMIDTQKHILISNLHKSGINILISILKGQFKRGLTNMKSTSIPLEKRRNNIITTILKYSKKTDINNILKLYFTKKEEIKEVKDFSWINNYSVGEELLCLTKEYGICWSKAIISQLNKNSITVNLYNYSEIPDYEVIKNQTWGEHRLIWNKFYKSKKIIYDKKYLIKQINFDDRKLKIFIEGTRSVDYGN